MLEGEGHFLANVMQKHVITIDSSATIQDAAKVMSGSHVGCVIVTNDSAPVGIITERDLVKRAIADGIPNTTKVSAIMSVPIITASPDATIWELAEIMKINYIHKAPIEQDGKLVGIITATDLVNLNSLGSSSEIVKITEKIMARR